MLRFHVVAVAIVGLTLGAVCCALLDLGICFLVGSALGIHAVLLLLGLLHVGLVLVLSVVGGCLLNGDLAHPCLVCILFVFGLFGEGCLCLRARSMACCSLVGLFVLPCLVCFIVLVCDFIELRFDALLFGGCGCFVVLLLLCKCGLLLCPLLHVVVRLDCILVVNVLGLGVEVSLVLLLFVLDRLSFVFVICFVLCEVLLRIVGSNFALDLGLASCRSFIGF